MHPGPRALQDAPAPTDPNSQCIPCWASIDVGTNGTKFVIEQVLIQTNPCACRPDLFHELSKLKAYFWGLR